VNKIGKAKLFPKNFEMKAQQYVNRKKLEGMANNYKLFRTFAAEFKRLNKKWH